MNYRHSYHAGSFADVMKHLITRLLFQQLQLKAGGCCYLETHAGPGEYALGSVEAQKTQESRNGILKLLGHRDEMRDAVVLDYLNAIMPSIPNNTDLTYYPGSPLLAESLLRPQDRMILCELHTQDAGELKHLFRRNPQVAVHHQDGYLALKGFLPPVLKRGLVLIDPSYEKPDELTLAQEALIQAVERWPTGVFALWFPIKKNMPTQQWYRRLEASSLPNVFEASLSVYPHDHPMGLLGSGMLIVNLPWQLEDKIAPALEILADQLGIDGQGHSECRWLIPRR